MRTAKQRAELRQPVTLTKPVKCGTEFNKKKATKNLLMGFCGFFLVIAFVAFPVAMIRPHMRQVNVIAYEECLQKFKTLDRTDADYVTKGVYAGIVAHAALGAFPNKPEIADKWFALEKQYRAVGTKETMSALGL